ncbi:MAG: cytidylate kinase family protein, partial [Nanoarchaeota archaeon]|nr:cytidylate kinase family protein [Nanoarchaeota archaeon]
MIITISGTPGSGKSTVAKILVKKLKAKRIYVGGIRRELAREKGISLEELNKYAKTHPETDVDVDKKAAKEATELAIHNDVIVEGRTQFHFLPDSVKIFIKVGLDIGAERIWPDLQNKVTEMERNEGRYASLSEFKEKLAEREENDAQRYQKYYGFDHRDEKQYDLVLDSSKITAQEVAEKI